MKKINKGFAEIINYKSWCFACMFLLCAGGTFSQDNASAIQQQFQAYNNNNYQEKVFLHTDKTVYISGEIFWFKAYVTNAADNNFSSLSSICYVEVFNADKKPLLQAKIDIDSGRGSGSFVIPSFMRTGNYLIRAYTNWMKNFDSSFYFEEPLTIINVNKKAQAADTTSTGTYSIQFFPEGGNMVYGLDNTVAFKLTDYHGKGMEGKGSVVNEKNETIANFETERFGMGKFTFNPMKGNKYHAVIKVDNKTLDHDLPEIYNNGWVLHVKDTGDAIIVNITSNFQTEHSVYLFAQTRHSVKLAKMQTLIAGSADFRINKSDIGEGITQLTVFNQEKQPVCERLYFKKPTNLLQVNLGQLEQGYLPRKNVQMSVTTGNTNGQAVNADVSVSVYLTDSLQPGPQVNLLNYLWLSSELRGTIESPQYYFENSGPEVAKATDNLMLTQGWRRFKWEDVFKNTNPSFTFLPEHEGHIITGKLSPKIPGLADTGVSVYLSVPGKNFRFSNSNSSASGYIRFNVRKFYGAHEIIAQTNSADSNYRVLIDNPFSGSSPDKEIQLLILEPSLSNKILLRSIGSQAGNTYQPEKKEIFALPASYDTTGFAGTPSKTYYLDDYTRFPTMEEVMREYVKEVHVKNRQKSFHYEVLNAPLLNYFSNEPLVLMDGVPVFDVNKVIELDPLKVKRIDVITNRLFAGRNQYDGVVSYSTYNNDLDGYQLDPNSLVIEYEGLQLKREFYSPQYETAQQVSGRIPDYRNVLYWSPGLQTINGKQDISFYTSDLPGKYVVVVQGISASGLAGFAATTFTVATEKR